MNIVAQQNTFTLTARPTFDDIENLEDQYAEFIMANGSNGDRVICNGDTLLEAMEDGYLIDEFLNFKLTQKV